MTRGRTEIDEVWQAIVAMVMDSRGDWRRKVAEATGLPFTRVRALRRLAGGPLTLRALAESLGTDAPAATVAVNDLERRGLVTRCEHPDDRRAKLVSLTPAGRATLRAGKSVPDPAPRPLAALSREDVKTLARIFK
ncbi:MAG TPA: MarR family transcriptional regulator [Polyangiaceae bacterium]|jgi:DNA-binding MarR family transcriptional regulator